MKRDSSSFQDKLFIKKTLQLAKRAEGYTSPNPMVGAVLVKEGKIISCGYHKKAGYPHAEVEAIDKAKQFCVGSTLYVNLEPCCHWGRTPPCVDKIIRSGIKRVVIATLDPNPSVRGKSVKILKKAGIKVKVGVLEEEAKKLNEIFFKNMQKRMPFVVVKVAQSLDGKIATFKGESKWITGIKARRFSKRLRDKYDAVCVGVNTVIKDNPSLEGMKKRTCKIVLDPILKIPLKAKLVKKAEGDLIIFTSKDNLHRKKVKYLKKKAFIYFLPLKKDSFSLKDALKILYEKHSICSVFVEGGAYTIGRFFDEGLVDKIYFFYAPKIIGGEKNLSSVGGEGIKRLQDVHRVKDLEIIRIGEDILISGYIR